MQFSYLAILAWQPIWHVLLPWPYGASNIWLGLAALVPMLIPLTGLLKLDHRALIWCGLILLIYFVIAVMEAWSNPPQRLPALVQAVLVVCYFFAIKLDSASRKDDQEAVKLDGTLNR
jgi:uncharacterized membrane protein